MPKKPTPLAERVWERVVFGDHDQCWTYLGYQSDRGYGLLYVSVQERPQGAARIVGLHRAIFFVCHGYWPTVVCHGCDNPLCVNPLHLFDCTNGDNNRHTVWQGRARRVRGEQHPHAKLTEADVLAIRASPERQYVLARRYGVDQSTISDICNRRRWPHI